MFRASDSCCFPLKQLRFWCIQNKTGHTNSFIQNPKITSVFLASYPLELGNSAFDNKFVRALSLIVEEAIVYHFEDPIKKIISVFLTEIE